MTWMVTGGAGYIGAHVVRAFMAAGIDVVVVDNLASGREEFVPESVPFVRASILDTAALARAMQEHECVGVVHVAGFKYAGRSEERRVGKEGRWGSAECGGKRSAETRYADNQTR